MFPSLLALAPSLFSLGQSIVQKNQADNLRPSNYVPPSITNAVAMARKNAASPTAPGYGVAVDRLKTTTANTINNAKRVAGNSAQLQAEVGQADAREKQADQNLAANNQQFQFNNRSDLMRWLGIRGNSEQRSWDAYNAAKSALIGASKQNLYNAVTGAATVGSAALNSKADSRLLDKILGGQSFEDSNLGGVGKGDGSSDLALGAGSGSIVGKTGISLLKALQNKIGNLDDNEKAYLASIGYDFNGVAPNLAIN